MDDFSRIKNSIRQLSGKTGGGLFVARVASVDGERAEIEYEGARFTDVRLRAVINGSESKALVTPATGSCVLAADLSGGKMEDIAVLACSEVERIDVCIGETSVKADRDGVTFNGGGLGGLVKVENMVSWMQKVYSDLSALKDQLAVTPVAGQGAPLALVFNMTTPAPAIDDFANRKIRQ
jgi:hypothetical protein